MNRQTLIISMSLSILYSCSKSDSEDFIYSKSLRDLEPTQHRQALQTSLPKISNGRFLSNVSTSNPVKEDRLQGKVTKTMNSGGYTYVSILTSSGETVWAAGRKTTIKVGEMIDLKKDMKMENFTSNTAMKSQRRTIYWTSNKLFCGRPKKLLGRLVIFFFETILTLSPRFQIFVSQ